MKDNHKPAAEISVAGLLRLIGSAEICRRLQAFCAWWIKGVMRKKAAID
ncbi:MAG: hypothetical protein OET90_00695 [Desulfuromonadales bacterium]|nr:hypothetical protein [Desulfuromonadales bacterium]